jgi:hypothetical protein
MRWTPLLLALYPIQNHADFEIGAEAYRQSDYATALQTFIPLAENGDARAQTVLALMYKYGEGVNQNLETAFAWYLKAAERNYAPAQLHAGAMLADGRGVDKDRDSAILWLTKAANAGFERAKDKLLELDIGSEKSIKPVANVIEWSQNWDLSLPDEIRFKDPEPIADARFRVQLGAMSSHDRAFSLWQRLTTINPSLFEGLSYTITETTQSDPVHRLQTGPFSTIQTARFFCDRLEQDPEMNSGCLPLKTAP